MTTRNQAAAIEIAQIANSTKAALAALNDKFAIRDGFKTTAGYIGIISLASLACLIIFIDVSNLLVYLFTNKSQIEALQNETTSKKVKLFYVPK